MARRVRIAVVGDVHEDWDLEEDGKALRFLQADVVLFTGDLSCEHVRIAESISKLQIQKAVILGNHDAGYSLQFSQRSLEFAEYQLQCLKEQHVGYSRLDFPYFGFSVVGSRPFSRGGEEMYQQELIRARYGIEDMKDSATKIYETALRAPPSHFVIFLAHNGPSGLGSRRDDICGKDWLFEGGDNGDPDLAEALTSLKKNTQISVPLVVFGHMHKESAYWNGSRKMIKVGVDNTIYVNGAIVPRVQVWRRENIMNSRNSSSKCKMSSLRAFTMIEIQDKVVERISETWVAVAGSKSKIAKEIILFERTPAGNVLQM